MPDNPQVKLHLTGAPCIELVHAHTQETIQWWGGSVRGGEALAYVATHGRSAALVDICMTVFRKFDSRHARKRFHDARAASQHSLRQASGYEDLTMLARSGGRDNYRVPEHVVIDIEEFRRLHHKATTTLDPVAAIELHVAAAAQIRGPLLSGADDFFWSARPRADLSRDVRLNYARLDKLLTEQERPWDAINVVVQSLTVDPDSEGVVRRLMRLYEQVDRPELAVAEYLKLASHLADVGRKPCAATTRLYRETCRRHGLS